MSDDLNEVISYFEQSKCNNFADFFDVAKNKFNKNQFIFLISYILENSKEEKLLNQSIRTINLLKYQEFLPMLIDFLLLHQNSNGFLDLKVLAIKTISTYKDKSSLNALMYCLNDKNSNYKIRLAAAEALGKIGDKNAFESLTNIVCDEEEKSTYVKESAVVALGMLGDNRALDVFNSIIDTKKMFSSKFSYLKERIVEAISKIDVQNNKIALKILRKSLYDNSPQLRICAIETLMNLELNESYDLIYDRLKSDPDLEVKKNALVALYNISDESILNEVINGDYSQELKCYADEILIGLEEK